MKKLRARRRKVIRVESEETQDYVREANDMNLEEAKEKCFVPSAISVPQKPLFRGDNQRRERTLSFWQFASVVKEGEKIRHDQRMPAMLQQVSGGNRGQTIDKVAVVRVCGEKGASWKVVENDGKRTVHSRTVGRVKEVSRGA